ncbi:MAG: sucrose phosphorylase [Acidimicrobiia bacterium]|jgi:sucrose phosphorylase
MDTASVRNGVQLITYVDRFGGGDLSTIHELLTGPLHGVFTGVHLLPFYRPYDRADAGFDPIDHKTVDPRLGNWESVRRIATTHDVVADLIVNHISDQSPEFEDYLANNEASAHAGMFLDFEHVFPEGATAEDLLAIYRPRPGLPFTTFTFADRSRRLLWTTFTPHQVDLDVGDPGARGYLHEILERLSRARVAMVRLDAIGYVVKKAGTSCFMTPETHEFIAELAEGVRARGMVSLLEIHSHHLEQVDTATEVDRVYDFALAPLILHAFQAGTALPLRRWLAISPRNAVTVLDTHDGIGVVDVGPSGELGGLLTEAQIDALVEAIHQATGGESRLATGESASNLDLYQVNSTYYSALGGDDHRYLLARLIQFLCPGIPQVYYAGLLAARNDMGLLQRTGVGRDINRPYFDLDSVRSALDTDVVQSLLSLIRFRNAHPAFQGEFSLGQGEANELSLAWRRGEAWIEATIDVEGLRFELRHSWGGSSGSITDWSGFVL